MLNIYLLTFDADLPKEDFEALKRLTSPEKAERIARFRRYEDSERSLLGDALARYAICGYASLHNSSLRFTSGANQKPMLDLNCLTSSRSAPDECLGGAHAGAAPGDPQPGAAPGPVFGDARAVSLTISRPRLHFNISHSGRHVVCALSGSQVGIDVELIKPIQLSVADRFFSADERAKIYSAPAQDRLGLFYGIWTRKESFVKMTGKGLAYPLEAFSSLDGHAAGLGGAVFYHSIGVGADASCHVCSNQPHVDALTRVGVGSLLAWASASAPEPENP
jgi:4'-phosphopantetheinyl transferase